jgi:hypothetical protein
MSNFGADIWKVADTRTELESGPALLRDFGRRCVIEPAFARGRRVQQSEA